MNKPEMRIDGIPQGQPEESGRSEPDSEPNSDAPAQNQTVQQKVIAALQEIYDPEIPVNIYELGLIYDVQIDPDNKVNIKMTLTSPACPVAESLPGQVRAHISRIIEVSDCDVELVWEPTWGPDRMSDAAKLKLGML